MSADVIKPACPHFGTCGGCSFQDISAASYEADKQRKIAELLAANGLETELRPLVPAAPRSRRRATFAATRTKKTLQLGYYARGTHVIVPVSECPLVVPEIEQALPSLLHLVEGGLSRTARASIAVTATEAGLDVSVESGKAIEDGKFRSDLAQRAAKGDFARLVWNGELVAERRAPIIELSGIKVALPPGAFLQPTKQGEEALVQLVREAVGPARKILDLFAGCGTFTAALAQSASIHAVEGEANQLAALEHAMHMQGPDRGLKPVTIERRDLFKRPLLPVELNKFEAVIIDPPRLGAAAQSAELAKSSVPRLAMVSCNPSTFARDSKVLVEGGYRLQWVTPVDQFLWSEHIELVGLFLKE